MDPFNSLSFKKEKDIEFKDTLVTILIDNSGSMRGKPISVLTLFWDTKSAEIQIRAGIPKIMSSNTPLIRGMAKWLKR